MSLRLISPWRIKISLMNLKKSNLTVQKDEDLLPDKLPTIASSGPLAEDVCLHAISCLSSPSVYSSTSLFHEQ